MRPEDIIAEFLENLDMSKTTPHAAAERLIDVLEREQMAVCHLAELDDRFPWDSE